MQVVGKEKNSKKWDGSIYRYYIAGQAMGLMDRGPVIENKVQVYLAQINDWTMDKLGWDTGIENIQFGIIEILNRNILSGLLQSTAETILMLGIITVYIFLFIHYKDFFFTFIIRLAHQKGTAAPKWV